MQVRVSQVEAELEDLSHNLDQLPLWIIRSCLESQLSHKIVNLLF